MILCGKLSIFLMESTGCEGRLPGQLPQVSVTLTDEKGNERYVSAEDAWLTEQGLEVGDHWPCELEKRIN